MAEVDKVEYRQLRDTIYTFFYYLNKPVGATEISLQFKNYKKSNIEKVLGDLVAKEKIFVRQMGKSKIYCLAQDMSFAIDDEGYTDEIDRSRDQGVEDRVLRYLIWKHEAVLGELSGLREENRVLESSIVSAENQLSTEELRRAIRDMRSVVESESRSTERQEVSYEDFGRAKRQCLELRKELGSRRGVFRGIVDGVCDGLEIKRKQFLEDVGVE